MKKTYCTPEVEVCLVAIEANILSNGENLNMRTYGSQPGESTDDFWK